jgi:hypothetical protein
VQHRFGERIDLLLQKSVRVATRQVKDRQREAQEKGTPQQPPSFEEFSALVKDLMDSGKKADLDRLRNLSLKELFEQTWSQKRRNYAIQRQIKDAYDALVRRSKRDSEKESLTANRFPRRKDSSQRRSGTLQFPLRLQSIIQIRAHKHGYEDECRISRRKPVQ